MIAIVGAKGGCGKTTTTLGLAAALARSGESTLAVDADRQLPNLHVAANVDREPTLADLADDRTVADVAHAPPEADDVGILPAPESTDADVPTLLRRLEGVSATVLVDCPAGVGPDVVEPLSVADRAVVVTTPADRSASAAATTVDVARRLGVEVVGTIVTRSDDVPETIETSVDTSVLGVVPADRSPLADDSSGEAYDGIAAELKAKSYAEATGIEYNRMVGRLETGIDVLDRKLDGGLPPGSVVAYTASPASQSELLLYELTAARGTLYLSTERSEESIRHALESSKARVGSPTVRHLDGTNPLEEAERLIGALPDGANLIVDTMNVLERTDRDDYLDFLNYLTGHMLETGGIALLHCLKGSAEPDNRGTTEHVADAVFDLRTTIGATELENHLAIPKFRGGGAPTETIKLELSRQVEIDTSRDIA